MLESSTDVQLISWSFILISTFEGNAPPDIALFLETSK